MFGLELLLPVRFNLNSDIMFASEKCLNSDLFFFYLCPPSSSVRLTHCSFISCTGCVIFNPKKDQSLSFLSQLAITRGTEVTNAGQ